MAHIHRRSHSDHDHDNAYVEYRVPSIYQQEESGSEQIFVTHERIPGPQYQSQPPSPPQPAIHVAGHGQRPEVHYQPPSPPQPSIHVAGHGRRPEAHHQSRPPSPPQPRIFVAGHAQRPGVYYQSRPPSPPQPTSSVPLRPRRPHISSYTVGYDRRPEKKKLPSWVSPVKQPDDEGGHYACRNSQSKEVYPTHENTQKTTSNYYSGGLGEAAWRQRKRKRAGLEPPQAHRPGQKTPQHPTIFCFVTIRGKPEFAEPAERFGKRFGADGEDDGCDDAYFADFLAKEYDRIMSKGRWYGSLFNFKTIAAVEFQTWKLKGRAWTLDDVDSIPETATRATMSHFSYQLRYPHVGSRHWVNKLKRSLKDANENESCKWNFRIHIIEMIDVRAIYLAASFATLPSAAAGIVYGILKEDFSTAFTVASYVLASFALIFAVLAAAEFLGIETPDSFSATDMYRKDFEIDRNYFPGGNK